MRALSWVFYFFGALFTIGALAGEAVYPKTASFFGGALLMAGIILHIIYRLSEWERTS